MLYEMYSKHRLKLVLKPEDEETNTVKADKFVAADAARRGVATNNSYMDLRTLSNLKQELDKNLQGIIDISVENSNDFINIIIEDNGVGFKATPKDLITPLTTTKQHGSGLGLSIVSKILHEHGGDLNFIEKSNGAKIKLSIKIN